MRSTQTILTLIQKRGVLLFCVMVCLLILGSIVVLSRDTSVAEEKHPSQVKFSHEFHVKEAGIICTDCHMLASTSIKADDNLLAPMSACASCHEDQSKSNCTYCHISADSTQYQASPNPVRTINFSHWNHADNQNISCEGCHKNLDRPIESVGEKVPSMTICSTCHNDVKASNSCEKCHTNLAALRPAEHNRTNFVREHKFSARLGDAKCGACHTQESCMDCHNGSELVKVDLPGKDLVSMRSPRLMVIDRGHGMNLTKIHDLNFKFTHGIAAKGKAMECQTCHSAEQFCSKCHEAGGNVNQGVFKPASHSVAGFTTLGVGSGGGEHARLAKRDIESCASCHSAEGADPVCITCHMDVDGIKGNDPKTHEKGFMSDNHGDWHENLGANCFMCHTDVNARPGGVKGQKFCGYCHR